MQVDHRGPSGSSRPSGPGWWCPAPWPRTRRRCVAGRGSAGWRPDRGDRRGPAGQLAEVVSTQPGACWTGEDERGWLLPHVLALAAKRRCRFAPSGPAVCRSGSGCVGASAWRTAISTGSVSGPDPDRPARGSRRGRCAGRLNGSAAHAVSSSTTFGTGLAASSQRCGVKGPSGARYTGRARAPALGVDHVHQPGDDRRPRMDAPRRRALGELDPLSLVVPVRRATVASFHSGWVE